MLEAHTNQQLRKKPAGQRRKRFLIREQSNSGVEMALKKLFRSSELFLRTSFSSSKTKLQYRLFSSVLV